jgi:GAF domain-containing protein
LAHASVPGVQWTPKGIFLLSSPLHDYQDDLDAIAAIPAVQSILEVICRTTSMGFAAIARVSDRRWICCAVKDDIAFGLKPGGELELETTICNEIRDSRQLVVIDHVAEDSVFHSHPTPAMYGFQSYISQPIILPDNSFFGTLCAIDPRPNTLNTPVVLGMFKSFADLIAFYLDTHFKLVASEKENARLHEQFRAGLGHDMRNTLAAMEAGTRLLQKNTLDARSAMIVTEMQSSAQKLSRQIADAMAPHQS